MQAQYINQQLEDARVGIYNALWEQEIFQLLEKVGYNSQKLLEGKALYEQTMLLQELHEDQHAERYGATDALYKEIEKAKTIYNRHRKLAKVAYEHNAKKLSVLKLNKPLPKRLDPLLSGIHRFYKVLLSDSTVIVRYGISEEDLAQAQAMTKALVDARKRQVAAKGYARHATQQRNKALNALKVWMKEFRQGARFALREKEPLLEVLCIPVRSVKKKSPKEKTNPDHPESPSHNEWPS